MVRMKCTSNAANWAVRIPLSMEMEHDILQASPSLLKSSPSPFGFKICTFQGSDSSNGVTQRLFYVSEQAARDRAPQKHSMNGVGVRQGWYMIGERNRFHIHAGVVKETEYAKRSENGFIVSINVDGQNTNKRRLYKKQGGIVEGHTSIWHGFRKSCVIDAATLTKNSKVDQFCFEDISDALEGKNVGPTETGTISMHVLAGYVHKRRTFVAPLEEKYSYAKQPISAKTVAREGRSIRVGSSGLGKVESKVLSDWGVSIRRNIEDAKVNVFVRSRHWLQSRRVIDDYDQPFKYVNLVRAQNAYAVAGKKRVQVLSTVNENERPKKRRLEVKKEKGVMNGESQEQSAEVVDLT